MAGKSCSSEKLQHFSGELSVASLVIEKLKQAPAYVVERSWSAWTAGIPNSSFPQPN
jgi:hypothetical protein